MIDNDIAKYNNIWDETWKKLSPMSEIQMWDYYGLRHWIIKYTPRYGKVLEAGCGYGRYNFYLSKFGIDIAGVDFSEEAINYLNNWKKKYGYDIDFRHCDVCELPFETNSLSGYLSFGVIEHFKEGPQKVLKEAYRVLRPGGIAIISTPSTSWLIAYRKTIKAIKNILKIIGGKKTYAHPFFQYEYRPRKLKRFVNNCGLHVTRYSGADLLYTFNELGKFTGDNLKEGSFAYWFSNRFENTVLNAIGAQSVTVSIKVDKKMYCFLCGKFSADKASLTMYDVPICNKCKTKSSAVFYNKKKVKNYVSYIISPPIKGPQDETCEFCDSQFTTDEIFENYGFTKKVCQDCLKDIDINILLSNKYIQPIWRNRSRNNKCGNTK